VKARPLLPAWARRVKPHLIRRLYENDAHGLRDPELVDEAGWALLTRCQSFLQADEAMRGRARCPACGETVQHTHRSTEVLRCAACGWECAWKQYAATIQNQQLNGGPEVIALFQSFVERFPQAQGYTAKMLLIDGLIHGFHHYLRSGRTRRPVGVNLIDGDLGFVIEFLDRLAYSPGSTPGTLEMKEHWRRCIRRTSNPKPDPQGKPPL
jgi:hypothetical protein